MAPREENIQALINFVYHHDELEGEENATHPLRQLLIDYFATVRSDSMNVWIDFLPQDLVVDIFKILLSDREKSINRTVDVYRRQSRAYHVEVPGELKLEPNPEALIPPMQSGDESPTRWRPIRQNETRQSFIRVRDPVPAFTTATWAFAAPPGPPSLVLTPAHAPGVSASLPQPGSLGSLYPSPGSVRVGLNIPRPSIPHYGIRSRDIPPLVIPRLNVPYFTTPTQSNTGDMRSSTDHQPSRRRITGEDSLAPVASAGRAENGGPSVSPQASAADGSTPLTSSMSSTRRSGLSTREPEDYLRSIFDGEDEYD
jgi:hypothetical protein